METNYQEINFSDYLKTILTRKKLIGKVALLTLSLSLIITALFINKPPLFTTDGFIAVGNVNGELLESHDQTRAFILTDKNGLFIIKSIKSEDNAVIPKSEVVDLLKRIAINDKTGEDGSVNNIIKIASIDENPERAVKIIEIINKLILERHQKIYETKLKIQDTLLAQKEDSIKEMRENLQKVESQLETLFQLRYPASYAIAQGTTSAEYIKTRNDLRSQIKVLEVEILSRKNTEKSDTASEVISPPLFPNVPTTVREAKLSVVLIIGSFLGIFLGILCAFIAEWWNDVKSKI